jgi:hypothetical protein
MGRKRSAEAISKTEAVRRALAAGKATAAEGVPWVQGQFGLDLTPNHFNTIKSTLGKGQGGGHKGGAGKPKPVPKAGEPDAVQAVRAVKEVLDQFGADTVRGLVDLLEGGK